MAAATRACDINNEKRRAHAPTTRRTVTTTRRLPRTSAHHCAQETTKEVSFLTSSGPRCVACRPCGVYPLVKSGNNRHSVAYRVKLQKTRKWKSRPASCCEWLTGAKTSEVAAPRPEPLRPQWQPPAERMARGGKWRSSPARCSAHAAPSRRRAHPRQA